MGWKERSEANLLPLSEENRKFRIALREWVYSGETYDLEEPKESCELCDHQGLRYQFKIINTHNGNELLVGSECINQFDIPALDELGRRLTSDESRRRVSRDRRFLVNDARKKRVIRSLVLLSAQDQEFEIESFITYLQDRGAFTPSQLGLLIWRFEKHGMQINPQDFKLIIRRDREKRQLLEMEDWKVLKIWPAMSNNQRQWYEDNKKSGRIAG